MTRAALLLFLLPGCVSIGYMERKVNTEKQSLEDRLSECQTNWQNEMRELDALKEDLKDKNYEIKWK